MRFVPYLFTIFLFVLVNNFYGLIPLFQFPTMSHIGFVVDRPDAGWSTTAPGSRRTVSLGYLKHETVPAGMIGPILLLLVPLEFLSNILVRPITLTLRLFATCSPGTSS